MCVRDQYLFRKIIHHIMCIHIHLFNNEVSELFFMYQPVRLYLTFMTIKSYGIYLVTQDVKCYGPVMFDKTRIL